MHGFRLYMTGLLNNNNMTSANVAPFVHFSNFSNDLWTKRIVLNIYAIALRFRLYLNDSRRTSSGYLIAGEGTLFESLSSASASVARYTAMNGISPSRFVSEATSVWQYLLKATEDHSEPKQEKGERLI